MNVSQGSGQALIDAVNKFAARSKHPELATAPFLLWGMSAGGQFNYEFTAWKPERVAAFVVNKGGIYFSAMVSPEARAVPGILFIGGKDLESRIWMISGLFAVNRRGGALWALTNEPGAGHIVGQSRDMAIAFYDDILPMRIGGRTARSSRFAEKTGFMGDLKAKTFTAIGDTKVADRAELLVPDRARRQDLANDRDEQAVEYSSRHPHFSEHRMIGSHSPGRARCSASPSPSARRGACSHCPLAAQTTVGQSDHDLLPRRRMCVRRRSSIASSWRRARTSRSRSRARTGNGF